MQDKTAWPKSVPILDEDDILRGELYNLNGEERCLLGWMTKTFSTFGEDCRMQVRSSIADEIEKMTAKPMPSELRADINHRGYENSYIVKFNDDRKISNRVIATIWNKVMARLGYTEGNPDGDS